jgi:hypothetical protein
MRVQSWLAVLLIAGLAGCDSASAPVSTAPPAAPPPPPLPPQAAPVAPAPAPTETRVAADQMLGVNAPGQKGADSPWTYTRTLFTNYFGVQETVALGQVKQALDIFEATNGRKPSTNEEGMEAMKNVPLPELPDDTYWYEFDPERQQLIVAHKEPAPQQ